MSEIRNRFAADIGTARAKLLAAATIAGARVRSFAHPLPGPDGAPLSTDAVWLGDPASPCVLVMTSGVHGVELFCGAGAQVDTLLGLDLAAYPGVALLVVHAVNPYGAAWLRRVNEDNIDINRNFVDFAAPLPENAGYADLADAFVPADGAPATLAAARERLDAYARAQGQAALRLATSGGQYTHPDGMFYGGTGPTWSRRTMEAIVAAFDLPARTRVVALDFHTGAGPFGYCEPIYSGDPAHPGCALLRRLIGPRMTMQRAGEAATPPQQGLISALWEHAVGANAAYVSLEYGTYANAEIIGSLRDDHMLARDHRRAQAAGANAAGPDMADPAVRAVKARLLRAFRPDEADWEESVLFQARAIVARVATGLAAETKMRSGPKSS